MTGCENETGRIGTVICDRDLLVRQGLRAMLGEDPAVEIVAMVDSISRAATVGRDARVDLVVSTIGALSVGEGVNPAGMLAADAFRALPNVLLVLEPGENRELLKAAIQAGVRGFVSKTDPAEVFREALRAVSGGLAFISPAPAHDVLHIVGSMRLPRPRMNGELVAVLTRREREVLILMADGSSNGDIARRLYVSEATVRSHVYRILHKAGLSSRSQAVAYAYRTELVRADGSHLGEVLSTP